MTWTGIVTGTCVERSAIGKSTCPRSPGPNSVPATRTTCAGRRGLHTAVQSPACVRKTKSHAPTAIRKVRATIQPFPRVRVLAGFALFSMNVMIWPAMSCPVAFSIPSSPGLEFTSMMTGP